MNNKTQQLGSSSKRSVPHPELKPYPVKVVTHEVMKLRREDASHRCASMPSIEDLLSAELDSNGELILPLETEEYDVIDDSLVNIPLLPKALRKHFSSEWELEVDVVEPSTVSMNKAGYVPVLPKSLRKSGLEKDVNGFFKPDFKEPVDNGRINDKAYSSPGRVQITVAEVLAEAARLQDEKMRQQELVEARKRNESFKRVADRNFAKSSSRVSEDLSTRCIELVEVLPVIVGSIVEDLG